MHLPYELIELVRDKHIVAAKDYTAAIRSRRLELIELVCRPGPGERDYIHVAAKTGNLALCQRFYNRFRNNSIRHYIHPAIKSNNRHILRWLCDLDRYTGTIVGNVAGEIGDIPTLEWLWQNYPEGAFSHFTIEYAVKAKQWLAVRWLFNRMPRKECEKALGWARVPWCQHPELLDWIRDIHPEIAIPEWFTRPFEWIFEHRHQYELESVLCHRQFPERELEKMVWHVNLNYFLKTQRVSLNFCVKYILNDEYYQDDNETSITVEDVVYYQGYTREQVLEALRAGNVAN